MQTSVFSSYSKIIQYLKYNRSGKSIVIHLFLPQKFTSLSEYISCGECVKIYTNESYKKCSDNACIN